MKSLNHKLKTHPMAASNTLQRLLDTDDGLPTLQIFSDFCLWQLGFIHTVPSNHLTLEEDAPKT